MSENIKKEILDENIIVSTTFAEKARAKYPDLMSAVKTIMEGYSDVMVFDRNRNTSVTIKLNDKLLSEEEQSGPRAYSSTWNRYIRLFVVEEDINKLLMSVENETIYEKLLNDGYYIHDYNVVYAGNPIRMQVAFAMVQAEKKYIIFGFKNITNR